MYNHVVHVPLNPTYTSRHHDTAVMRSLLYRTSAAARPSLQNDAASVNRVLTVIVSRVFEARKAKGRSSSGAQR